MNRRIIIDPIQSDRGARGFVGGVITFTLVLVLAALLSVDEVETERRPVPEMQP